MLAIVSAMPEEIMLVLGALTHPARRSCGGREFHTGALHGTEVVVVFSHWGKVAAAATVAQLLACWPVRGLIFCGVAGAVSPELAIGDIVVGDSLIQHDMDASPVFPRYQVPLLGKALFNADAALCTRLHGAASAFLRHDLTATVTAQDREHFGIRAPKVVTGLIASGDKFFASAAQIADLRARLPQAACVEMEGAAAAQVCESYGVPYGVVRTISDGADDEAAHDFPHFIGGVARQYTAGILARLLRAA